MKNNYIFIFLLLIVSCIKDNLYSDLKVQCFIISDMSGNKPLVDYIYNKKKLTKIIEYGKDGKIAQQLIPGFDGEGKISIVRYLNAKNVEFAYLNYEYTESKLIKKTSYFTKGPTEDTLKYYRLYTFNSVKQLVKEYYYTNKDGNPFLEYYVFYTYNGVGNVTFSQKFKWDPYYKQEVLEYSSEFEYDSYTNKNIELPKIWEYASLSNNNITKAKNRDKYGSDLSNSYYSIFEYTTDGFPSREIRTLMFGGESTVLDYKYNTYNPNDTIPRT